MFFDMTALYGVRKVQDLTKYQIHGGRPLHGTIEISGAKNAAVAIIPAALMVDGVCRIENIPQISDVTLILQILRELGADVKTVNKNTVDVDCSHIRNRQVPYDLARKIRASYYLVGALLGRLGWAEVPLPGGCDLGGRPIDQHIKGFVAMGADVDVRNGLICAQVPGGGRLAGGLAGRGSHALRDASREVDAGAQDGRLCRARLQQFAARRGPRECSRRAQGRDAPPWLHHHGGS